MSFKKDVMNLVDTIKNYIDLHKKNDNIIFKLINISDRRVKNNKKVYDVDFSLSVDGVDGYSIYYRLLFDKELNISVSSDLAKEEPNVRNFPRMETLENMYNLVNYILQEYNLKFCKDVVSKHLKEKGVIVNEEQVQDFKNKVEDYIENELLNKDNINKIILSHYKRF